MTNLHQKITKEEEGEVFLGSMDFYRPSLKQIGNSLHEIKTHYIAQDVINIIPSKCPTHLSGIKNTLLSHLDRNSFLFNKNIVTGCAIDSTNALESIRPCFLVLMDSLALVMDMTMPQRPSYVQCDVLLAICGQPVIVLSLVDGDKDSDIVTMYNTSLARGVSSTLCKFMDESVNCVYGVLHVGELKELHTFQASVGEIAKDSSLFVSLNTLTTNPSKYEKIVTAFWAGVAETRSVVSRDGRVDTDYIRFLTKDQCVVLMENINNREVEVKCQTGTGATTLMVEVARRLSRLDSTLLVCRSIEEKERLRWAEKVSDHQYGTEYPRIVTPDELNSIDLSSFQHVLDETNNMRHTHTGRLWRFTFAEEDRRKENIQLSNKVEVDLTEINEKSANIDHTLEDNMDREDSVETQLSAPSLPYLKQRIYSREEQEFYLRSMDLFRPPLKQIGNSIDEVKTHYMSNDFLTTIPSQSPPHLAGIQTMFLKHLKSDSFLYKKNIVTGSALEQTAGQVNILPNLVVFMDSLALAMHFEISPRPSDVQCDILLVICGQPVIVLTLVDGDKDSGTVTMYNSSVARGVSSSLCKFMNESANCVFGVLCRRDIEDLVTLRTSIEAIARASSCFIPLSTLATNPSKYEKIVTSFWAGVAETRSVVSRDGRVDTDYLRFLTKDQCIILMDNINNREVEVQFQTGTGATTLMVEVARRLARLDETLLVCRSQEEKVKLRSVFPYIKTPADLRCSDLLKLKHVVNETALPLRPTVGRLWAFTKDPLVLDELKKDVMAFEKIQNKMKNLISLLSSDEVQDKALNVSKESETLKLLDVIIQSLSLINALSRRLALEFTPVPQYPPGQGDRNQRPETGVGDKRLETEDYLNHVLYQTIRGIKTRRDLFPLLCDMITQIRNPVIDLRLKTDTQSNDSEKITDGSDGSESPMDDRRKDDVIKLIVAKVNWQHIVHNLPEGMFEIRVPDFSPTKEQDKPRPQNETGPGKTDLEHQTTLETSTGKTPLESCHAKVTDSEEIKELQETLKTMEKEVSPQKDEMSDLPAAADRLVEWEDTMDWMAQQMSTLKIKDIIADVIEGEGIPLSFDSPVKQPALEADHRSTRKRSLVYQMREMQYGTVKTGELMDIARDVTTDDLTRLTYTLFHFDSLGNGPAMTLHRDRVHRWLDVSEDGQELVNRRESGHHSDQFQVYPGTCSRLPIPLPPSPSTLTAPTYWETHTRVQVKSEVPVWDILLEMGVSEEGQVDTENLVGEQSRGWGVLVTGCDKHPGICTQVWSEWSQCGVCLTDTLTHTPGTDVSLKYGAVVDIGRGRLAFIDLNRGRVLHTFDVKMRESIRPMFGVWPDPDKKDVTMRLVSGSEITMDDRKQNLIAKALFGQ